ncbi:NAC domain-containing protein 90-like isoform X2 [Amaranthus tricolor]|uniref:NAC domain-containing protein 90-like isoform X2 n=1 Tax=Amaranthus tricolor TaxID=29722 RepID=UPI00258FE823|nr:NAC domain-containing protein 90-like isoform X2 [Amaranthus tricolor]
MEQLPPGFRFYPTEEELITFYLHNRFHNQRSELDRVIPSIDIYNFEPSQLPGELCHGDMEQWFFFMQQQEREARGGRPNRTTASGYWKATGSPSYVYSSQTNKVIGVKKTLVFYKGKAPTGRKTKWKMNEYKAVKQQHNNIASSSTTTAVPELMHGLSLYRVYITSGCARAFDRRPPGTILGDIGAQNVRDYKADLQTSEAAASQSANPKTLLVEKSSSTDGSNSGCDDQETIQHAAAGNSYSSEIEMAEDGTFWDWKQLDWL